jgi:hypothetical protein
LAEHTAKLICAEALGTMMEAVASTMRQNVATMLMAGKCALAAGHMSVMAERRRRGFHAKEKKRRQTDSSATGKSCGVGGSDASLTRNSLATTAKQRILKKGFIIH